jgi:4-aminobutyrate aminotransferase-like enzyme
LELVWDLGFGIWIFSGHVLRTPTQSTLDLLRAYESRNVTFMEADGSWPIVWERARGVHVWDAEGKKYLDLTAAFGVAAAGHANPRVVRAGQRQMAKLLHAMGDVHPHALKARLARELSRFTFERWSKARGPKAEVTNRGKVIFCNSGFEAVEAALKTAILATGKPGVIAFEGGYHGLGYGALNATHREHFRGAFRSQLGEFGSFVSFPEDESALPKLACQISSLLLKQPIGAVLVEPIQARGGIRVPPLEFLRMLRRVCDKHGVLLILDEIYTGFGRTGKWFACEHSGVVPDLICLGKALTGGFPLSACVGRADLMDAAWPASTGEAIHTSTFLGHPVGCAMALANIEEIRTKNLVERSARLGDALLRELFKVQSSTFKVRSFARGLGLMAGVELVNEDGSPATEVALCIIKQLLHRGFIFLPEGEHANVISFTPPLTITESQIRSAVRALKKILSHG